MSGARDPSLSLHEFRQNSQIKKPELKSRSQLAASLPSVLPVNSRPARRRIHDQAAAKLLWPQGPPGPLASGLGETSDLAAASESDSGHIGATGGISDDGLESAARWRTMEAAKLP